MTVGYQIRWVTNVELWGKGAEWHVHQHLEVISDAAKHLMQNINLQIRSQTDANALARQKGFNNTAGVIFSSAFTWESKAQDPLQMCEHL